MVNIFQNSPGRGRQRPSWSAKSVTLIFDDRSPHMILWYWRSMPARTSTILLDSVFFFWLGLFVCIMAQWWGDLSGYNLRGAVKAYFAVVPALDDLDHDRANKRAKLCLCSATVASLVPCLAWGLPCLQKYVWHCVLTILFKLNAYSLDMRALKKVTRQFSASQRGSLVPMKTLGCGREQLRGLGCGGSVPKPRQCPSDIRLGERTAMRFSNLFNNIQQCQQCEQEAKKC